MLGKRNKVIALACALVIGMVALFSITPVKAQAVTGGMSFSASATYKASSAPSALPLTFEAWLQLDTSVSGRGGAIVGNYVGSGSNAVNLEIHENGVPRLYFQTGTTSAEVKFTGVDVRGNDWTHLAVTFDRNASTVKCYVNGVIKGTKTLSLSSAFTVSSGLALGGDLRTGNAQYFKGKIKSLALFSTVRTDAQILADKTSVSATETGLLALYSISGTESTTVEDLSANNYDMILKSDWFDNSPAPTDYAYSFMVVGDTQIITEKHPQKLANVYDYIVANVESKKVKHVFGLGDITNSDTDAEWRVAKEQIAKMDGVVPYSLVRGNHDFKTGFDTYFGATNAPYRQQFKASYDNTARNTVHEFRAGNLDYLVIALDYGPSDAVMAWASEMIEAHPYHNVIVTTHAYLFRDGTTLDQGDVCPPATTGGHNNGDHMWDKFIKKHENIVLVLSGHDPCDRLVMTQTVGENGNTVTQMLVDPQGMDSSMGGVGMVATLYFSADGTTVTTEWYSTIKNKYYKSENHYTFTIDTVASQSGSVIEVEGRGSVLPGKIYHDGQSKELMLEPQTHALLSKLEVNGVDVTSQVVNGKYLFAGTSEPVSIKATFIDEPKYTVTLDYDQTIGTITLEEGFTFTNYAGERVKAIIKGNDEYRVKRLLLTVKK